MDDQKIIDALRAYIFANDAMRKNKQSWLSSPPPGRETAEGAEYHRVRDAYRKAKSDLWEVTDFEYGDDPMRKAVWTWRYWNIMARKCCWHQRFGSTRRAGWTMRKLQEAEDKMVEVCGLTDIYRSPCSYIEEAFPGLKKAVK